MDAGVTAMLLPFAAVLQVYVLAPETVKVVLFPAHTVGFVLLMFSGDAMPTLTILTAVAVQPLLSPVTV